MRIDWQARLAGEADISALEALIDLSVRTLHVKYYSPEQIKASIGVVFGVDRQLIRDGTYYVMEREGRVIGCGGWSKRRSLYGLDSLRTAPDPELVPGQDAARIRAFFVHPEWTRRGIAGRIMNECESAIAAAGFGEVVIIATLAGEPFYATFGYAVEERYDIALAGGLRLPVVRMTRR
jgi:N-acetylglutamate synthase-like GNAT family acetyltransferase